MQKKIILIIGILYMAAILSGCWNNREVNSFLIVAGTAIDYDEKEAMYTLTTEVINPKDEGLGIKGVTYKSEGKTVFDAIRNIIMISDRKLFWGHIQVIIIGERAARKGLVPVLDLFYRDHEIRRNIYVLIANTPRASDVYDASYDNIHKINSFTIASVLQSKKDLPVYHSSSLWDVIRSLSGEGISLSLPMVGLKSESESSEVDVSGIAVFKKDKMVGELTFEESKCFLAAINQLKGGVLVIHGAHDQNSIEIFNCSVKSYPVIKGGKPTVVMDISISVNIAETNGQLDLNDEQSYKIVEEEVENTISKKIKSIITKAQQEFHSDIFGFGALVKRKAPSVWKKEKTKWDEIFTNLEVTVNVKVNVRGSAVTRNALKYR